MVRIDTLRSEAIDCLTENILPFWLNNMRDHYRGGWYGQMTGHGELVKNAPRSAVLYARLLWTFAAAYRVLGSMESKEHILPSLLQAATRTRDYILQHFIDKEQGGVYWSVTADGKPLDSKKQFYAIAFMIYGFSEYARATGDRSSLQTAVELFKVIELYGWDATHNGYIEACMRDWQPISDMRLSTKDENYPKSQNTHLHILESYTNLYRVLDELRCKKDLDADYDSIVDSLYSRLKTLITLFTDRILNPKTHHLDLFFDMDWKRKSTTASYGHDIECSWLLHEASLVLDDEHLLSHTESIVREVAQAGEEGLRMDGSMVYESDDEDRHWWVQAEAVVGFFNLYQHFDDEAALKKALNLWEYIKVYLIDYEHGEWYWSVRADGSVNLDEDHAGFWKCPYHNARMCLEIIQRTATLSQE